MMSLPLNQWSCSNAQACQNVQVVALLITTRDNPDDATVCLLLAGLLAVAQGQQIKVWLDADLLARCSALQFQSWHYHVMVAA